MNEKYFKGTMELTKLLFRQDRKKIIIWLLGLIVVTIAAAYSYPDIYKDEPSKQAFALTMDNPAMVAMLGPGYSDEHYLQSIGTLFAHEMLLFSVVAVAIMNILLVGRSTRADEEDGRIELIRALPVGRLTYVTSSMIVILITNILLVILIGFGLMALGINGLNAESAFLYGAILGSSGIIFAAFTAVFAQLAETSRETTTLAFGFLIMTYLIRATGDVSNETVALISPLGWMVRTGVFADNDWWPVIVALALSVVIIALAFYLNVIRDIGSGFFPARKGRKHASTFLLTPFGLAWRLQRTSIISWAIGLFALSASFGAILGDLELYFADNEFVQAFLPSDAGYTMTEQFITLLMAIMALLSTIPVVQAVLKLKGEESKDRIDHYFSRAVSRTKLLGSYYGLAFVLSLLYQGLVAIGLWSVGAAVMEEGLSFTTTISSAIVYLPAMWLLVAFAVFFIGVLPKATGFIWFYVIYCFIVIYLGGILDFPKWMNAISPFDHIPQIPADDMKVIPLITLTIMTLLITLLGFVGYKRRDIRG